MMRGTEEVVDSSLLFVVLSYYIPDSEYLRETEIVNIIGYGIINSF